MAQMVETIRQPVTENTVVVGGSAAAGRFIDWVIKAFEG